MAAFDGAVVDRAHVPANLIEALWREFVTLRLQEALERRRSHLAQTKLRQVRDEALAKKALELAPKEPAKKTKRARNAKPGGSAEPILEPPLLKEASSEVVKGPAKEAVREVLKEAPKEVTKVTAKDPVKETVKETTKDISKEPPKRPRAETRDVDVAALAARPEEPRVSKLPVADKSANKNVEKGGLDKNAQAVKEPKSEVV